MATTVTPIITNVTLQPGTRNFGPVSLPVGLTTLKLALDRTGWNDPTTFISFGIDLSLDGGVTWASQNPGPATNPYPVTAGTDCGQLFDKHNNLITESSFTELFPDPANAQRQIKGFVTVTGNAIKTSCTLTTS